MLDVLNSFANITHLDEICNKHTKKERKRKKMFVKRKEILPLHWKHYYK